MKILLAILTLSLLFSTAQADEPYSQAELNQLLAPVALYPDTVLSHLLIATTYPLEVVQAQRWSSRNPNLEGEEAVNAVSRERWDPSVKALVAFPHILERMADDLDWTQQVGDAFLHSESMVLATIQDLRQRAYQAGNLKTTEHQEVVIEQRTIVIEPRVSEVIYIPYYDTQVIYGPWYWSAHPPVVWHRPSRGYWYGNVYWSHGTRIHSGFYFSSFHWHNRHTVVVNVHHHSGPRFHSGRSVVRYQDAKRWRHNPTHRRGVEYRHAHTRQQYASPLHRTRATTRHSRSERQAAQVQRNLREQSQLHQRTESRSNAPERSSRSVQTRQAAEPASRLNQRLEQRLEQRSPSNRRVTRHTERTTEEQTDRQEATQPQGSTSRQDSRTGRDTSRNPEHRSNSRTNSPSFQRSARDRIDARTRTTTSDRGGRRTTTRDR